MCHPRCSGGQSPRKVWQDWDSEAGEWGHPTSPTHRMLDTILPPVLMTPSARMRHGLELLPGCTTQEETLWKPLPEIPLNSCVILCKPSTFSFPDCQVDNHLFPTSFRL